MFILSTIQYLSFVETIEWKDHFFFGPEIGTPHDISNIPFKTGGLPQDQSICMFFSTVKTSNLRFIAPGFEITTALMYFSRRVSVLYKFQSRDPLLNSHRASMSKFRKWPQISARLADNQLCARATQCSALIGLKSEGSTRATVRTVTEHVSMLHG